METKSNSNLIWILKTFSRVTALSAFSIGLFLLVLPWIAKTNDPLELPTLKVWKALCIMMASGALLLVNVRLQDRKGLYLGCFRMILAASVLAVGILSGLDHLLSWNFQTDFPIRKALGQTGEISFQASLNFTFFGYILLGMGRGRVRIKTPFAEELGVLTAFLNFLACLGVLYGIKRLYALFPMGAISFHASLACLLLSLSLLASMPQGRIVATILSERIGGVLFRTYLPEIVLFPLATGFFKYFGEKYGYFDKDLSLALVMGMSFAFLMTLAWRSSRLLDSLDRERSKFSEELHRVNEGLEQKVQVRTTEIAESEAFLRSLVENIPNMIFVKDAQDLRFAQFNKAGEELLGYKREDLMGKNDYDFFPKDQADFFTQKDRAVFESRTLLDIPEEEIKTRNQGVRILHTKKIPIFDQKGAPKFLLGVSEDITELKKAQKTILEDQAIIAAEARMAEVGAMAGGIAHEINNPLGIIQLEAGLLKMQAEEGFNAQALKKSAERIENTAQRISKVIKGLRAFAGDSEANIFKKSSLFSIFETSLGLCRQKFQNLGVVLELQEISPSIELECLPVEISQVIYSVLYNAFEAALKAKEKWVRITVTDSQDDVEIAFIDSGHGISEEARDKIFLPFYTTKDIGKGMGLGLSISKGIVEKHQGTLRLDLSSDHTRFVLRLPKVRRQPENHPMQASGSMRDVA